MSNRPAKGFFIYTPFMDILNNPTFEVVLSLIATWALFAILCSFGNEIIAEIVAERGRFLKKKIHDQLQDLSNGVNWATSLYTHGSIDLLSRADNKPSADIPPKLFAEVMVESVANSHLVQTLIRGPLAANASQAEIDFRETYKKIQYNNQVLKDFKAATMVLKPSDVISLYKQALSSAELRAGEKSTTPAEYEANVYKYLIENICNWYGSFSGRISTWYKKRTRLRLFMMGIVVAGLFQVDSIQLYQFYRSQPEARATVITYFKDNIDDLEQKYVNDTTSEAEHRKMLYNEFKKEMSTVTKSIDLPIGWDKADLDRSDRSPWWSWTAKVLGILLTALAGSYGAPFWFELFRKITRKS